MGEDNGGVAVCTTNHPIQPLQSSSKACDECKTHEFKYKCPGCSLHSCSLSCVKAHKQRTGCTGKRQQHTEFVPLSKFDDNLLLSDYNMLEDVKRIADSAKRRRVKLCGNYVRGLPFHLKRLHTAARNRKIKLFFLPNGMSKRETNKTSYNNSEKSISWTVEWCFYSTNIKLIDHGIHENSNIFSVIQNHLKPGPRNHPLKPFCLESLESLRFIISKNPKQLDSPFRELDIHVPIHKQLANVVIIEYPVIHVFLPSHSLNFKVDKYVDPHPIPFKADPANDSQPGPKGVFFREEEIKDDDTAGPRVLDLKDETSSKTETKDEGFIQESLDFTNNDTEVGVIDFMNFDFEPELIDVYSSLISETNPDDFLDFDGLCDDLPSQENLQCGTVTEELEEGEIADSD